MNNEQLKNINQATRQYSPPTYKPTDKRIGKYAALPFLVFCIILIIFPYI